jgi:NCS1 family nucleobase:cation symporter-1
MLGQALGLPLTMTAFAFIGVAVTSATVLIYGVAIPNPVDLMARFDSVLIILFATAVIFAAQLTTNMAANVVSPSNDFSNLNPRLISYVTGGLITAVIGILMMPWKLMSSMGAYIFTWLIGYSGLMGAIAGILICDYWVIRKRLLDLEGLFDPHGQYSYGNGFNWRAIVALCGDRSRRAGLSSRGVNTRRAGQYSDLCRSPVHLCMVRDFCAGIRHILRLNTRFEGRLA